MRSIKFGLAVLAVFLFAPAPAQSQLKPRVCTREYKPVCASRAGVLRTYPNACEARVDGARIVAQGACKKTP